MKSTDRHTPDLSQTMSSTDAAHPIDVTEDTGTTRRNQTESFKEVESVDAGGYHDEGVPQAGGEDNTYTRLDEEPYEALDEENDREVASRGGAANYTQEVEATPDTGLHDDADTREGELPIQEFDREAQRIANEEDAEAMTDMPHRERVT